MSLPRFTTCLPGTPCWLLALAALVVIGAPQLGHPSLAVPLRDHGRDSSVNAVLQQSLGERDLAPRLTAWLETLPSGKPILVLAPPGQMDAAMAANLVSYLAWPRPVIISTDSERSRKLLQNYRERYAAVGLCYLPPPPGLTIDQPFGRALGFITMAHVALDVNPPTREAPNSYGVRRPVAAMVGAERRGEMSGGFAFPHGGSRATLSIGSGQAVSHEEHGATRACAIALGTTRSTFACPWAIRPPIQHCRASFPPSFPSCTWEPAERTERSEIPSVRSPKGVRGGERSNSVLHGEPSGTERSEIARRRRPVGLRWRAQATRQLAKRARRANAAAFVNVSAGWSESDL